MLGRETFSSLRGAATRVNEAGYDAQLVVRELAELKPLAEEVLAAWKTAGQVATIAMVVVAVVCIAGIGIVAAREKS